MGNKYNTGLSAFDCGNNMSRKSSRDIEHLFAEVLFDPESFESITGNPMYVGISAEVAEARYDLASHVLANISNVCTEKQTQALNYYLTGMYSQRDIGQLMGISQSAVHKLLQGNINYIDGKQVARYGGAINNLKIWSNTDPECLRLVALIKDLSHDT